jgi:hypothetical protein
MRSEKVTSWRGDRIFGDQTSVAKNRKKRTNETTARKRVADNRNRPPDMWCSNSNYLHHPDPEN